MIKLYKYQNSGVESIRNFLKEGGKHALFTAPTGGGKTVIFSYIAQNATLKNKKVLILTDRTELLMQTGGELEEFGLKPHFIRGGSKFINFKKTVYVAMCRTLRNRMKIDFWLKWFLNDIDIIIIDEAHKQDFNYLFQQGLVDNKIVIGFTATPNRTGSMRQFGLDYESIIESVSVLDLVQMGYLVDDKYYGLAGADLNDIKVDVGKGDFSETAMFDRFNSPKLYAGVVKNWQEKANNTHTIVFCVNIEHVIQTCEEFHKNGINAKFLVSKMKPPKEPKKDADHSAWAKYQERIRLYNLYLDRFGAWSGRRNDVIKSFKQKEFPVLINAGILTTGFNCPSIETVIVNRSTISVTLWRQMIGRGSRTSPGKYNFTILDFGGNAKRLGHYKEKQDWSLWHDEECNDISGAILKDCGISKDNVVFKDSKGVTGCGRVILESYSSCPFCGFSYLDMQVPEVTLQLLEPSKKIVDMPIDDLYAYYEKKNYKPPWLWRQLYFRGGEALIKQFAGKNQWSKDVIAEALYFVRKLNTKEI